MDRRFGSRAARLALVLVSASAAFAGCSCSDEPGDDGAPGAGPGASSSSTGLMTSAASSSAAATSGAGGGGSTCAPGSIDGFEPEWVPPTTIHQGVCTPMQAEDFFSQCVTSNNCPGFTADNPECAQCALTFVGSSQYGPVYFDEASGLSWVNQAGCVAATTGDTSDTGCGAKIQATEQCTIAACEGCDFSGVGDYDAYVTCLLDAETSSCQAYAKASDDCFEAAVDRGGPVVDCAEKRGEPAQDVFIRIVNVFCGAGSSGGTGGTGGVGGTGGTGGDLP